MVSGLVELVGFNALLTDPSLVSTCARWGDTCTTTITSHEWAPLRLPPLATRRARASSSSTRPLSCTASTTSSPTIQQRCSRQRSGSSWSTRSRAGWTSSGTQ